MLLLLLLLNNKALLNNFTLTIYYQSLRMYNKTISSVILNYSISLVCFMFFSHASALYFPSLELIMKIFISIID